MRGIPVKAGERAAMFYVSANRDATHFRDPNRFDISRAPNPHLAFGGGGTHFCLGANLARVEASAIIPEVLERMSGLELVGPVERTRSNLINGIHSMPSDSRPLDPPAFGDKHSPAQSPGDNLSGVPMGFPPWSAGLVRDDLA